MALRLEWLGIAEGSANDARGALALLGVNQDVIAAPSLPHVQREVLIVHVADDDGDILTEGTNLYVELKVDSPSGRTLSSSRSSVTLGKKQYPTIPATHIQVLAEVMMRFEEYGSYTVTCNVEAPEDQRIQGRKKIYVVDPSTAQTDSQNIPLQGRSMAESSS
jgi:hypothetical protein